MHPVCLQPVFVVTRAQNAMSDVNHDEAHQRSSVVFIAVDTLQQILQTVTTLAVAFKLFSMKQEKLIEIGLHWVHTNLVSSEAFKTKSSIYITYFR